MVKNSLAWPATTQDGFLLRSELRADPEPVGRDTDEPTFERSGANGVNILPRPRCEDARGGRIGSTESCPTVG